MPTPEEEAKLKLDKEAADKKVADDAAKKAADDEAAKKAAGGGGDDETVTIKKKDWEKTNSDLDNYRTGLINKKTQDRTLDQNAGGGNNDAGNGGGAPTLDEKRVTEIATKATQATTHKANEKAAIKQFLKTHADYTEDKNWAELLPFLPANINKDDPAAIVDAMEGAVLLHKRATGKLDTYLADQAEKAKQEAEMNARVDLGFGAGGIGHRANQGNQADKVPETTIEMGKRFGHDADKLEKDLKEIPKNPEGGYSIDVTKKPKK